MAHDLSGLTLFNGCDERQLSTLASMLSPVDEPSGAVLARQGEVAHSFLVVTTGEAAVLRDDGDGEHQVATVGPGAIVGELSVLLAAPRSATKYMAKSYTGPRNSHTCQIRYRTPPSSRTPYGFTWTPARSSRS